MLKESLAITDSKKREQAFLHMVKSWHQGNLEGLEELVETMKTYPLFYEKALSPTKQKTGYHKLRNF